MRGLNRPGSCEISVEPSMHAEVIAIGTELTTGAMLDTNSQWLSLELANLGIPVRYHTTVADDLDAMIGVFRDAVERSDIVIITGGLGPTLDDLTRQALAGVLGTELALHAESLDYIRSIFARHRRDMPERNAIQAYFPKGSEPIPNPRGTAPGIWAAVSRDGRSASLVAALPGVPHEMKRMFLKEVVPRLPRSTQVIERARVHCFGVGESKAEEMLGDLTARGRDPEIGITVHEATITLRIVAHGQSSQDCREKIDVAKSAIHERLGDLVFGEEDDELEHIVVRLLADRGLTFTTAEVGTGGLLARRITEVPGQGRSYRGGIVAFDNAALFRTLDGAPFHGETNAAVIIAAAAESCRRKFDADFALTIGEFPPYNPEDSTQEAPSSHVALSGSGVDRCVEYTFLGDSQLNKSRATKVALNLLRLHLIRTEKR
jgi:nicotinamide-nucleotide amidase